MDRISPYNDDMSTLYHQFIKILHSFDCLRNKRVIYLRVKSGGDIRLIWQIVNFNLMFKRFL